MGIRLTRSDRHIETGVQFLYQAVDIRWVMLAVGVHENKDIARGIPRPRFDGCSISHGIDMRHDPDVILVADFSGIIN